MNFPLREHWSYLFKAFPLSLLLVIIYFYYYSFVLEEVEEEAFWKTRCFVTEFLLMVDGGFLE